jgi:vibriolysin
VTEREAVERVVHVDDSGTAHIALHTKFFNELQGDVAPAFWNHIYDANSGALLARWNDVHTVDQASGPSGNPKVVHTWNQELDAEPKGTGFVLTTARLKTLNMNQTSSNATEVTGTLELIGDAPLNDAHGYAEVTLNMMQEWMGRNSIDDRGFQIKSRVHYNRNYENAFWDGSQMTYGDGANTFYPLSGGVDVCAHEINHGYTTKHSNLAYSNQSGGLNEGFSDIAGKTAEFYYKENPNFDLGGDVFKQPGRALRYMCNPPQDGKSIDKASNMRPSLDPHYSSGIPNKVFCLASKRMSSGDPAAPTATKEGVKRTAQAFYLANGQYWTSSSTFVAGCQGTLDAARALQYTEEEINNIKASWADVGVACN